MPRGRPLSADSKAQRILAYLRDHADQPVATRDIAAALDSDDAKYVSATLYTRSGRLPAHTQSEWEHVRRLSRGYWIYDTVPVREPEPLTWEVIGHAANGAVVLRRSDTDTLWLASPL